MVQERICEHRACRFLAQPRNTQRYQSQQVDDEPALLHEMRSLARQRPRFGSGRIHRLLTQRGWMVNEKRVHNFSPEDKSTTPSKQIREQQKQTKKAASMVALHTICTPNKLSACILRE